MNSNIKKILNLIRISDTFFPIGSFTISQGIEQLASEELLPKEKINQILELYVEKIWKSFDYQIFIQALQAAQNNNIEELISLDELCFISKIAEENRLSTVRTGSNLATAASFNQNTMGETYTSLIKEGKAWGTYPVVLAILSSHLGLGQEGGLSLIYVNLIEVAASLVRLTNIDYLEAQTLISKIIEKIDVNSASLADIHQSFPLTDIASIRHERNPNRMFTS